MPMWETAAAAVLLIVAACAWPYLRGRRRRSPRALESTDVFLFRVAAASGAPERHVGIVSGDLRRVRHADVWVNSENTMMRMARFEEFSISSIIRYEGAVRDEFGSVLMDTIADELARKVAGRVPVPPATAVITGAGELSRNGVRHIAHVAAVHGEPGAGFRQVREIGRCVINVLAELDRLGEEAEARTVLFPLLGVGRGGGALEPTVDALLNAAIEYVTAVPHAKAGTVLFLAYTDAELRRCKRVFVGHPRLRAVPASTMDLATAAQAVRPRAPVRADDRTSPAPLPYGHRKLQVGIVVDVVGYGRRTAPIQELVQRRLVRLGAAAVAATGLDLDRLDHQGTGDGLIVVLPADCDPTTALPALIRHMTLALAEDNGHHDDRIRLRMAVGVGISMPGAAGLAGPMVVDINRLVDSEPLRRAVRAMPDADLAILLSEQVHGYFVRPGYLSLRPDELRPVRVTAKEFDQRAWLWIPRLDPH
jgi:O-acetyl-ADP-ribose deacetylase (regulator of RNase III)